MKVTFAKPKIEPRFVGTVYTPYGRPEVSTDDQPKVYRVNIGKEATDTGMGNDVMPTGNYVAQSDFLNLEGIETWVEEQVAALEKDGKKVEFDENASYVMCKALEQLAAESPITLKKS